MSADRAVLTPERRIDLGDTVLDWHRLEPQFRDLNQQHEAAVLGMWAFLATEVMFFGALFLGVGAYHVLYPEACEKASAKLNWMVGGINTVVLLVSSLFMALAVHHAKHGNRRPLMWYLGLTAALGGVFLCLKGFEYYTDFRDNLVPGVRFDDHEWREQGVDPGRVKLFLLFYWIMTALHGLHVTIGACAVLVMLELARRNTFTPPYYAPVDVTGLYWHFVDLVWIFLLPMLYLLGTHNWADFHIL